MGQVYRKALTTNSNAASFASKVPTITEPTNDGVIDLAPSAQWVQILPYGLGSENDAFDMKVIGWRRIGPGPQGPTTNWLWVPTTICVVTCTVSAAVGVAASQVLNTERFADTIVMKSATAQPLQTDQNATPATQYQGVMVRIYSPVDDTIGWIMVPLIGLEKLEFTFDQTTGTPTMNVLFAYF